MSAGRRKRRFRSWRARQRFSAHDTNQASTSPRETHVPRRRFRWPIYPTGEGVRLLLLLAVMGFAAFNTRNNLLYLVFSVALAAAVISIGAGWLSLRGLRVETSEPSDLYAGTVCAEQLRLRNHSRIFDAYGTVLEELDFPGPSPQLSLSHLGRGKSAKVALEKVYPRRGILESQRMRVSTGFPFGLVRANRDVRLARKLTIFPRINRVNISFAFQGRSGSVPKRQQRGESEELLRLREYVSGDNLHHIHWKSTAKLGNLMVREFSSEQRRRFCIVFDNTEGGRTSEAEFETMVSAAASLAAHLAAHDLAFSFVSAEEVFPHGASQEHLRGVLTYLAVVKRQSVAGQDLVGRVSEAVRREETVFLLGLHEGGRLSTLSSPQLHAVDPAALMVQEQHAGV
jgi:uncharacterized protein (DUF58 family)